MHSRIIEARENKEDVCGISETTFYDCDDVRTFSDYIANIRYEDDPGDWLSHPGLEWDPDERTLTLVDKELYFRRKHERFVETADKLKDVSISEFADIAMSYLVMSLNWSYDDNLAVHLYGLEYYGCGLCTLDDWVRNMPNGTKVYIGNMVDYHN